MSSTPSDRPTEPEVQACPKGGEHHWKFNSGNPVCLKCDQYRGDSRIVLPATLYEDGTVHVPGDEMPCCDYRDHVSGVCACPDHEWSVLHPFGGSEGSGW